MEVSKCFKPLLVAVVLMVLGAPITMAGKTGIHFQSLSLEQAVAKAKTQNKLVFVDVYTTWCGPCKYLSKEVFTKQSVGNLYNQHFISIKIDAEKGEGPQLMSRFDVDAFPTLLYIDGQGELVKKKVGAGGPEALVSWGNDVVHPEESLLYVLGQELAENPSSKLLMADYIEALVADGADPSETVASYVKQYPKLDLDNTQDFLVFMHMTKSLDDPLVQDYLDRAPDLAMQHGSESNDVIIELIQGSMNNAIRTRDDSRLAADIAQIYPAYAATFAEDAHAEAELLKLLTEQYDLKIQ